MPALRKPSETVVAIACGDIHLSATPPVARAGEPDWYAAMAYALQQVRDLSKSYNVPILCAGDLFHHWKAPPELINFAQEHLPFMFAIPGQHDLPFHSYDLLEKSAFRTLELMDSIENISGLRHLTGMNTDLFVQGCAWGFPVVPPAFERHKDKKTDRASGLAILVQHAYRWVEGASYYGATDETCVDRRPLKEYEGFDTVIIGDNHKSWDMVTSPWPNPQSVFNCGSLMRRNADQLHHRPRVGLIMADGHVRSHYLDISGEVFDPGAHDGAAVALATLRESSMEAVAFARLHDELQKLEVGNVEAVDFLDALQVVLSNVTMSDEAAKIVREVMDGRKQ